VKVQKIKTK